MRETRLRWFDYVKIRMSDNAAVSRCERINLLILECRRGSGRSKKS